MEAKIFIAPIEEQKRFRDDAQNFARLHAKCFFHAWDTLCFEKFFYDSHVLSVAAWPIGKREKLLGFICIRALLEEAEILTIAVDPAVRNQAIGHQLLAYSMRLLRTKKIRKIFLEVDEANESAKALYSKFYFSKIGKRKGYYESFDKKRSDALILCYDFEKEKSIIK